MLKRKEVINLLDGRLNVIGSIRKANVEGMQEVLTPESLTEEDWQKETEISSIDDVYEEEGLSQQEYQLRNINRLFYSGAMFENINDDLSRLRK